MADIQKIRERVQLATGAVKLARQQAEHRRVAPTRGLLIMAENHLSWAIREINTPPKKWWQFWR